MSAATPATDALRPGATPEARGAAAYRDGATAARERHPGPCPFDGDAASAVERVCALMWTRGFGSANPMPEPTDETSPGQTPG